MELPRVNVSERLRELRIHAGYTQDELAGILMTTAPTICKIEKGRVPDAVMYENWKYVCLEQPKKFVYIHRKGGAGILQTV